MGEERVMRDVRASGQGQGEEVKCESHGQVEGRRCKPTAAAHFVNARTACSRVQAIADVWAWISTDLHLSRLTERRDCRRNVRRAAGKHSYLSGRRFPFRHPSLILVRSYAISHAISCAIAHIAPDHASQGTRISIEARRQRSRSRHCNDFRSHGGASTPEARRASTRGSHRLGFNPRPWLTRLRLRCSLHSGAATLSLHSFLSPPLHVGALLAGPRVGSTCQCSATRHHALPRLGGRKHRLAHCLPPQALHQAAAQASAAGALVPIAQGAAALQPFQQAAGFESGQHCLVAQPAALRAVRAS
ncbi:hypothetical protein L1887_58700 [Cichorium endivia]|nr:hypothetical protein L1887_58700 [Cichorium endivia]